MSLLGLDIGTTGCKAAVFSTQGEQLNLVYEEYAYNSPQPGWAEMEVEAVWGKIKTLVKKVLQGTSSDPVTALCVASLGEACVPVSLDRGALGPSILNFDVRGQEYLQGLEDRLDATHLYQVNGNTLSNQYSLTKLMWIRDHQTDLYTRADLFLHWSSFVAFMLGADPALDYSLANRTLLFDLDHATWSQEFAELAQIDLRKLPRLVPSGTPIGTVSPHVAQELGLPAGVTIVSGAHDQCASAVGCGAIQADQAFYGMGSYHCITPVMDRRREPSIMLPLGLNTEHHAVPGKFVSFLYNHGGTLVKWFRDTFAVEEHRQAKAKGQDIYYPLFAELPESLSSVLVLPNFAPTGPPEFLTDSCGVIYGLHLDTSRGDILKGIVEGIGFYLKECVDSLENTGFSIDSYRAVGGGSNSDAWVQLSADLFGRPISRPVIREAGAIGAAIMAGVGSAVFPDFQAGVKAMVRLERTFEPNPLRQERYRARFEQYHQLYTQLKDNLAAFHRVNHSGGA
jgi:xylulokinase